MLFAYLNYPGPNVVCHGDEACQEIKKHDKAEQQEACIDVRNVSVELLKFVGGKYEFRSDAAHNDMWIQIDFKDIALEEAILHYILDRLGERYSPFAGIDVRRHC